MHRLKKYIEGIQKMEYMSKDSTSFSLEFHYYV